MPSKNFRRHSRIPYSGPVRISWQSANGGQEYALGKCLDVSEAGLRVESSEPVPVRTMILLRVERLKVSGSATVRHAGRRGAKYILGLELSAALLEQTLAAAVAQTSQTTSA